LEWTPLHLNSLTRNKVDKDMREQQVARMEFKALLNNSQQEDRSRTVSSKTLEDHLNFSHFVNLDQLVSLKLDIDLSFSSLLLICCCCYIDCKTVYPDLNEGPEGTCQEQFIYEEPELNIIKKVIRDSIIDEVSVLNHWLLLQAGSLMILLRFSPKTYGSPASFIFFNVSTTIFSASFQLRPTECSGSLCLASAEVLSVMYTKCVC
jgi:hypothetical protein